MTQPQQNQITPLPTAEHIRQQKLDHGHKSCDLGITDTPGKGHENTTQEVKEET